MGLKSIDVYTDGAYSSTKQQGGVGLVFISDNKPIYKYQRMYKTNSNNKMELLAVIIALNALCKPVLNYTIYSDSQYVIGCINNNWQRRKNKILWNVFDKVLEKAKSYSNKLEFHWVKGHDNNIYNNMADALANQASQQIN